MERVGLEPLAPKMGWMNVAADAFFGRLGWEEEWKASTSGIAQDYRGVPLALAGGGAFAQRAELIGTCN